MYRTYINMKKIKAWVRKHQKKIIIADAAMIVVVCALLAFISTPLNVEGLQVTDSTYSTVHLKWNKTGNTAAYRIYRSEDGEAYEYLDSTAENTFTDKKLHTGTKYYYKIVARNGLRTSDIDETDAAEVVPSLEAPKLDIDTTQGEMKLSFTPVEGAAGYEIFRDGESIGQTEGTEFKDEQAESQGGGFNYEVKAYRYEKEPVYSAASNKVGAEMYAVTGFNVAVSDTDLKISWNKNDHYSTYRLYNGDEIIGETTEDKFRISGFDLDKIYKLKLVAFTSDGSEQSPDINKQFKVFEEEMTNEDAIEAAVQWGIDIAADDSFTYGAGQRAHRYGCYFCQTNVGPRKNIKGKSKVNGHSYEKTYCCNPFVHACYAHGAGDPAMLKACQSGHGIAMTKKSFTRYGHWKSAGKVSKSNLRRGDVLVRSDHVMMYIGDGQIVHASGGGWDAGSIQVTSLGGRKYSFVMRYTGNGRGVKYVVKDVDDIGNVIEDPAATA